MTIKMRSKPTTDFESGPTISKTQDKTRQDKTRLSGLERVGLLLLLVLVEL